MSNTVYVDEKHLLNRIPVVGGIAWWLLLDRLDAADWIHAVFWTLYILCLIAVISIRVKAVRAEPRWRYRGEK